MVHQSAMKAVQSLLMLRRTSGIESIHIFCGLQYKTRAVCSFRCNMLERGGQQLTANGNTRRRYSAWPFRDIPGIQLVLIAHTTGPQLSYCKQKECFDNRGGLPQKHIFVPRPRVRRRAVEIKLQTSFQGRSSSLRNLSFVELLSIAEQNWPSDHLQQFARLGLCTDCFDASAAAFQVELKELANPSVAPISEQPYAGRDYSCAPERCNGALTRVSVLCCALCLEMV